jgi:hypothetical protein
MAGHSRPKNGVASLAVVPAMTLCEQVRFYPTFFASHAVVRSHATLCAASL